MAVSARSFKDRARAVLSLSLAAYALDVPFDQLRDDKRCPTSSFARHVAMYIAHVAFGMSIGRVANAFGRDRSTVGVACAQLESRREDARFDRWLEALERAATSAPAPFTTIGEAT